MSNNKLLVLKVKVKYMGNILRYGIQKKVFKIEKYPFNI